VHGFCIASQALSLKAVGAVIHRPMLRERSPSSKVLWPVLDAKRYYTRGFFLQQNSSPSFHNHQNQMKSQ
jgi:hypothetical protein